MRSVRRDWMSLEVGPRALNHYHSSLKSREWVVAMPHHADDKSIFGALSWRHSEHSEPYGFLAWQHIFEGMGKIREASPDTQILVLTEACYSGGAIKFMDDESLNYWRELELWPIFLIATAGEAQQSISGLMQLFVAQCKLALEDRAVDGSLLNVFEQAVDAYWERQNFVFRENAKIVRQSSQNIKRMSEINHSFALKSRIHEAHVSTFFG
eukprot:TRINITY_DN8972_c0_g1_i3.p2 TRINITY_DN8972_c0_g1~~TRINITY_DN8972_c0_g1_i3.p2  ORF type:complete len:211 (-),score=57.34 TRINITY_DN8972_c0_g1_i3:167-799(-)